MTTIHTIIPSVVGDLQLVAGDGGLRGLHMAGQKYFVDPAVDSRPDPSAELFVRAAEQLEAYFAGDLRAFDLPVEFVGTAVQVSIWEQLRLIPFGATTTYGALAAAIGKPGMAQGVGQAVGHNPVCIVVPCHRVIGANGALTGYAGGLERKRRLLELEGALQPGLL
ncbi:MAG: methylated-DNA--[protein]-cysteine S-methyltransferase [Solirubrobacteraceae bacterium]|nr:methylated-DNA--[protein]-cysteine S-methyltransferase [Solirubrobacteraceae bacterium]